MKYCSSNIWKHTLFQEIVVSVWRQFDNWHNFFKHCLWFVLILIFFHFSVMSSDAVKKRKPKVIRSEGGTPEAKRGRGETDQVSGCEMHSRWFQQSSPLTLYSFFFSNNSHVQLSAVSSHVKFRKVRLRQVKVQSSMFHSFRLQMCFFHELFRWAAVSRYVDVRLMWRVYVGQDSRRTSSYRTEEAVYSKESGSYEICVSLLLLLSIWQLQGPKWTLIEHQMSMNIVM